ncbi:MAG: sigma-70 family RNA polymerase sigma factor [Minicystis sp.]
MNDRLEEAFEEAALRCAKRPVDEVRRLRGQVMDIFRRELKMVWRHLHHRGVRGEALEDLTQETFLALFVFMLDHGPPDNVGGLLRVLAEGKVRNHHRAERRTPESVALPSSGSEKPESQPDMERAIDLRELMRLARETLPPEHLVVFEKIVVQGMSLADAAAALDEPEGTIKTRYAAAKREMLPVAKRFVPPSQR